ncbi:uncharacterized protein LOC119223819 [Pungitius pungitius]|uniref:uncharacterized protein LOC119223819 n=1 Tax=Pungitius pungitius TaxID=134920 RepID=UPI002E12DBA4
MSVSVSEPQKVVQPGEEVTLTCINISTYPSHTEWFRVTGRTKPTCVASMYGSDGKVSTCVGFEHGFKMSSDNMTIYLKIEQVDLSHSGLYFCGFYNARHTIIANATLLIVQDNSQSGGGADSNIEKGPDGMTNLMSVILAGLTLFLIIVVIVLAVKIKKLQTAVNEEPGAERNKDLRSDEPNYAAIRFQVNQKRGRRPACERELETNVVYAATR